MRPYGDNAEQYWQAGWRGVLPLPVKRKDPPPYGYTGANGEWPSFADVYAWTEGPEGDGNIGLRLPSDVLGIDVDAYSGKVGRLTLDRAFMKWGFLPHTWVSTSRDDGVSGIYLYRVPDDMRWPGEVGPGIELIQRRHRYMVAPPSIHPSGKPYGWLDPDGYPRDEHPPNIDELPWLPDAWVQGLTLGELAQDTSKPWVTDAQVGAWLAAAPMGPLCRQVRAAVTATTGKLREAKHSRHESATRGVMRLVHLGSEGHAGVPEALGVVRGVFLAVATQGVSPRSPEAAQGEWERMIYGAVGLVMPDGFDVADPCTNPLGVAANESRSPAPLTHENNLGAERFSPANRENGKHLTPAMLADNPDDCATIPHDSPVPYFGVQSVDHGPGNDNDVTMREFDSTPTPIDTDSAVESPQVLNVSEGLSLTDVSTLSHDSLFLLGQEFTETAPRAVNENLTRDEHSQSVFPASGTLNAENSHSSSPSVIRVIPDTGQDSSRAMIADGDENTVGNQALQMTDTPLTLPTADILKLGHEETLAQDPELGFMVEQALLRQRANDMAREILAREKAHATFRVPPSLPTLADELALPDEEVEWSIAEVLPHGTNVLLTAQYKTGKTTLVNHLAKTLADGSDFLARFLVHSAPCNVALWNYEVSAGMYRRWLRDILIKNTDHVSIANLRGYSIPLLVPVVQAFAVEWLATRNIHTWVVDPAARAMPGLDENSNMEVGQFLDTLDSIKEKAGVANLILATHTGRAEMMQGRERARGATRFDDWADVRWLLTKDDDGYRYFRATGRDVDTDEYRLTFDPLTRSLSATDEERSAPIRARASKVTDGEVADVIVRVVREVPGQSRAAIEANVRTRIKARNTRIHEMMKALESQGVIVGIDGKRGATHFYPPDVARSLPSDPFPT